MPNLKIQTTTDISVPKGTKVITNNEFVTFARKKNGNILLYTCRADEIHSIDLNVEENWMEFTREELKKIIAL